MQIDTHENEIVLATFVLNEIQFALDTRGVQEAVILEKPLVPWPSSREYVEGILDLRGKIVPVLNLKRRLRMRDTTYERDCRVAVVSVRGLTIGILFDGVKDVIRISPNRIELLSEALQGEDRIITGVINRPDGIIEILNTAELVSASSFSEENMEDVSKAETVDAVPEKNVQLVAFEQGGQSFGIDIKYVKEIEVVDEVDCSFRSALIYGAVTVHECQIPIIHMRSVGPGDSEGEAGEEAEVAHPQSIIILAVDDSHFAVAIDKVKEMITVKESEIMTLSLRNGEFGIGVVQPKTGGHLLILDPPVTFDAHIRDIHAMNNIFRRDSLVLYAAPKQRDADVDDSSAERYLFFEVDQLFAIELGAVQEILPPMEAILPPAEIPHMEGVLNLRRTLLPLFSMRSFLELERLPRGDLENRKVIVLNTDGQTVALVVDRILNLSSGAKETEVPTLNRKLNRKRRIFKSLLVSRERDGDRKHALQIDSRALIGELISAQSSPQRNEV